MYLSALIACEYADKYGCDAYIYDAVCTNEVEPIARVTGLHDVKRRPFSHTLSTRAVAREVADRIGALATVVSGDVDGIILTGGCAYDQRLTDEITGRVRFLAPVTVIPGAMEMEALANGVRRVLEGKEGYHIYGTEQ